MTRPAPGLLPPIGHAAWLALGLNALSCLGSGLTTPFLIVYLHAVRGIALPAAGLSLALIGVAGIAATPFCGPLVDRIGALPVFAGGLALGGAGIAAFVLARSPALSLRRITPRDANLGVAGAAGERGAAW